MKPVLFLYALLFMLFHTVSYCQSDNSIQRSSPFRAGPTLTLKECIAKAILNNVEAQSSDLQAESSAITLRQSKSNALPDLFANLGHGLNDGRSIDPFSNSYINRSVAYGNYGLSSGIILYNGSQNKNTIQQNRLSYEADKLDAAQTKENIMINVILAYLQILTNRDLLQQSKNSAEVTRKQVERLATLDKAGAIAPALYYDLKGQLANDELAIINNQNALDGAKLSLAQIMNVPFDKSLDVENLSPADVSNVSTSTPDEIYKIASQQFPLIKASQLRRESAAKGLQVARGSYYPTISLSGSINTNYSNAANRSIFLNTSEVASGDYVTVNGNKIPVITQHSNFSNENIKYVTQFNNNYSTSLFLNLRIPILNAYRAKNRMALAKVNIKAADLNAASANTQLSQLIEQAYFNLNAAGERVSTLEKQVADFRESFRTAEVRFNAGAITQVDYVIAKNNVDRSAGNLIIAKYDYVFRSRILDYYKGRLSF